MIISICPIQLLFTAPFKTLCALFVAIDGNQSSYWGLFSYAIFMIDEIYNVNLVCIFYHAVLVKKIKL